MTPTLFKNTLLAGAAFGALAFAAPAVFSTDAAHAEMNVGGGTLAGNLGVVTDYTFRAISQSNERPALQGGLDWTSDGGAYLGVWASGVDFRDADVEIDFYGGYGQTMENGLAWKLGGIYYAYPGADDNLNYDYWEIMGMLSSDFGVFSANTSINYSPDFFGGSGDSWYLQGNVDVPLPYDFTAKAHIGHQWIDDNRAFGVQDYMDWSLGVGYKFEKFNLGLTYIDTDLDEPGECADGCSERIVGSVVFNF